MGRVLLLSMSMSMHCICLAAQGREKDVIVFCCVRANKAEGRKKKARLAGAASPASLSLIDLDAANTTPGR